MWSVGRLGSHTFNEEHLPGSPEHCVDATTQESTCHPAPKFDCAALGNADLNRKAASSIHPDMHLVLARLDLNQFTLTISDGPGMAIVNEQVHRPEDTVEIANPG